MRFHGCLGYTYILNFIANARSELNSKKMNKYKYVYSKYQKNFLEQCLTEFFSIELFLLEDIHPL